MCALSSFPYLDIERDTKFYLAFFGQLLNGVGASMSGCLPTNVFQAWFGESQRMLAIGVMTMIANPGRVNTINLKISFTLL